MREREVGGIGIRQGGLLQQQLQRFASLLGDPHRAHCRQPVA